MFNTSLPTTWSVHIQPEDILRGQGVDPRRARPVLQMAAARALAEGLPLLHPIAFTREIPIHSFRHARLHLEGGAALSGPLVVRHLAGAQRLVIAICSLGQELEGAVARMFADDPLHALALDGLGNAAIENLAQQVCSRIEAQVQAQGLHASTPLSPGSPEWPVEIGQAEIFAILPPSTVGISLTSGGMMIPKKSMSFVVGIGAEMEQTNMCAVCSLKETCRYQHA